MSFAKIDNKYLSFGKNCFVCVHLWISSKHINVELTLKQRWSSTFTNVVLTLIFGWKWRLSRRTFIDVVSSLTKERRNNVEIITLVQCWWPNIQFKIKVESTYVHGRCFDVEKLSLKQLGQRLLYWWCSLQSCSITKQH